MVSIRSSRPKNDLGCGGGNSPGMLYEYKTLDPPVVEIADLD